MAAGRTPKQLWVFLYHIAKPAINHDTPLHIALLSASNEREARAGSLLPSGRLCYTRANGQMAEGMRKPDGREPARR